eukprot:Rhum_TRINITY_DN13883_c0_g2::Rhum_TRINITY_DN13883_c0_g2_i2::g.65285::m.65285
MMSKGRRKRDEGRVGAHDHKVFSHLLSSLPTQSHLPRLLEILRAPRPAQHLRDAAEHADGHAVRPHPRSRADRPPLGHLHSRFALRVARREHRTRRPRAAVGVRRDEQPDERRVRVDHTPVQRRAPVAVQKLRSDASTAPPRRRRRRRRRRPAAAACPQRLQQRVQHLGGAAAARAVVQGRLPLPCVTPQHHCARRVPRRRRARGEQQAHQGERRVSAPHDAAQQLVERRAVRRRDAPAAAAAGSGGGGGGGGRIETRLQRARRSLLVRQARDAECVGAEHRRCRSRRSRRRRATPDAGCVCGQQQRVERRVAQVVEEGKVACAGSGGCPGHVVVAVVGVVVVAAFFMFLRRRFLFAVLFTRRTVAVAAAVAVVLLQVLRVLPQPRAPHQLLRQQRLRKQLAVHSAAYAAAAGRRHRRRRDGRGRAPATRSHHSRHRFAHSHRLQRVSAQLSEVCPLQPAPRDTRRIRAPPQLQHLRPHASNRTFPRRRLACAASSCRTEPTARAHATRLP